MTIIATSDKESTFEPVPEGVHLAVCYGVVDLGDQYSEQFKNTARKIQLLWEFPFETYTNKEGIEKPRFISREYTLSLGEKANLRKDLTAWRNKAFTEAELAGFDLQNILGKACQISIIHKESNGSKRANIAGIMALTKGTKTPELINELIYFDLDSGETIDTLDIYIATLPAFLQKRIQESSTYQAIKYPENKIEVTLEIGDEEIPF